ncbi:hypothetical protein Ddye_029142 [Dipteronia dyeriana]|uniref:Uncharacterized protein n=1 Tax=Dipteronia dyeriana TaxID=168575 RepID=A0AAD9WLE8_9ROSI|nr:hypothetical protein Ddye_029142 [Dipteronia dyeriana]
MGDPRTPGHPSPLPTSTAAVQTMHLSRSARVGTCTLTRLPQAKNMQGPTQCVGVSTVVDLTWFFFDLVTSSCFDPEKGDLHLPLIAFDQGLRLPLHPFIRKILASLEIAPSYLGPLAWRNIIGLFILWVEDDGNKFVITFGQLYLKCTHPMENTVPQGKKPEGDWKMKWVIAQGLGKTVLVQKEIMSIHTTFNYEDMAPSGLKILKKVNLAITKGFGNVELNFLDLALGTNALNVISLLSLSEVLLVRLLPKDLRKLGKEVVDGDATSYLKFAIERFTQIFSEKKNEKEALVCFDRFLEQVMSSLGENFAHYLLLEQVVAFQVASFGDEREKLKTDVDSLHKENEMLLFLISSFEQVRNDLSSKVLTLEAENKSLIQANEDFVVANKELVGSPEEGFQNDYFLAQTHVVHHGSSDWDVYFLAGGKVRLVLLGGSFSIHRGFSTSFR